MKNKKILCISVSGIGNTILFTPFLNSLRRNLPKSEIDLLVWNKTMSDCINNSQLVDNVFYFSLGLFNKISLLVRLRQKTYDVSVTAFPSNKLQFHLLAFLVGAKKRVIHSYKFGKYGTLSFLSNFKIKSDERLRDVQNNMNLLKAFNINPRDQEIRPVFPLNADEITFADCWLESNNIKDNDFLIGIHPGCKKSQSYKRWPQNSFVGLMNKLNDGSKKCLLFAGPDEMEEVQEIYHRLKRRNLNKIVDEKKIRNVAAIINKCSIFLSTDSGLGHVAAVLGVPTLAIFGPTMHTRISPYGENADIIRTGIECSPCLKYPFYATHDNIKCRKGMKCLKELQVDTVFEALESLLEN